MATFGDCHLFHRRWISRVAFPPRVGFQSRFLNKAAVWAKVFNEQF